MPPRRPSIPGPLAAVLALTLLGPSPAPADEGPPPASEARRAADAIKPLPPVAIPDDPPPHEGAFFDLPYVVEPPDILVVEAIEALPGRPITGERLVRPDGTISLGFYGNISVRGLTPLQIKLKLIHHLRDHLTDEHLGLNRIDAGVGPVQPLPRPGTKIPHEHPAPAPEAPAEPSPTPDADAPKLPRPKPDATAGTGPARAKLARLASRPAQQPAEPAAPAAEMDGPAEDQSFLIYIDPVDSDRIFVDVTSFNSKVYLVQGDVGTPGRLPTTGKDTILDAINYAGGLVPTAEPQDIHLYRPARGGKPAKDYKIDLAAILKGDARANLQMFPNDRLVVGRNVTVQKTIELDRAAGPINSVYSAILQNSFATRAFGLAAGEINGTTAAQRDAAVKEWADFLWQVSSKEGGALLDEKAFREAVMKKLGPAMEPKK